MKRKVLSALLLFALMAGSFCGCAREAEPGVEVIFDPAYDSAGTFTQEVPVNDSLQMPDNPQRDGYSFAGWYEKTADGALAESPYDFVESTVSAGFTLYAKWDAVGRDMGSRTDEPRVSYESGVLTVAAEDDCEVSFNDGAYSDEKTFACDNASRVKISVRRSATAEKDASESTTFYYTVKPNAEDFTFSAPSNAYQTVEVEVKNADIYEYKFEGSTVWSKGEEFTNLAPIEQQKVRIRVCAEGDYPVSESVETTVTVRVDKDQDLVTVVQYIWGGSTETATISQNTKGEGLYGKNSTKSIKISDKDITAYNDYAVRIPDGYDAFSADVKVILNTRSAFTKDLPLTNGTGEYLGAIKLGKWQKIYASGGDWIVTFAFPELIAGETDPVGTATIYLDNITFYTKKQVDNGSWNPTLWVANSTGTGDGDALDDLRSKFDVTLGTEKSLCKNFRNRYVLQTDASEVNAAHLIRVKGPRFTNISGYSGVSFAVDLQMNGSGGARIPFYLVKKGVTYTPDQLKDLSDFSDGETFIKIHEYKVDAVGGIFNGSEIVTISAEQLKAAGYDLKSLNDLTVVFRDVELSANGGWWNVYNMYFYDFKCY